MVANEVGGLEVTAVGVWIGNVVCEGLLWVKSKVTTFRAAPRSCRVFVRFRVFLSSQCADEDPRMLSAVVLSLFNLKVSSLFDVDAPLLCDSALFAFLDIGSFPFFDDDAPLPLLAPEALVIGIGLLELTDTDSSESLVVGFGLRIVGADSSESLGADSTFSQTASDTVTSPLLTQLIDKLNRTFEAVRQVCSPPTSRDRLAV
jgi:hypothetical protein